MFTDQMLQDKKIRWSLFSAVTILISLTLYKNSLFDIVGTVMRREDSSHGVFIPFISAFFLWKQRRKLVQIVPAFDLVPGVLVMMIGLLLRYASNANSSMLHPVISYFVMIAGVIICLLGWKLFKEVSFPFLYLMTMIPLPAQVSARTAEWMRFLTTHAACWIASFSGVPLVREGYAIDLPEVKLDVNLGCSGIRYLISYMVFALPYAFYFKKSLRSRILTVLAAIPISLTASIIRLSAILVGAYYISPFVAYHNEHVLISWFVFALVLSLAIVLDSKFSASK